MKYSVAPITCTITTKVVLSNCYELLSSLYELHWTSNLSYLKPTITTLYSAPTMNDRLNNLNFSETMNYSRTLINYYVTSFQLLLMIHFSQLMIS